MQRISDDRTFVCNHHIRRAASESTIFSASGPTLMREEVTMVIVDTSYLELCQPFNAHTSTKTHTQRIGISSSMLRRIKAKALKMYILRHGQT